MSWEEDIELVGTNPFDRNLSDHDIEWEWLRLKGYVWKDRAGKCYKEKDIEDTHILNILKFCERHYRPESQVLLLEQIAVKRGLIR